MDSSMTGEAPEKYEPPKFDPIPKPLVKLMKRLSNLSPIGQRKLAYRFLHAMVEAATPEVRERMRKQMAVRLYIHLNVPVPDHLLDEQAEMANVQRRLSK